MNNDYPYISVVMPVFNAEEFIEKAINSILSQTYTKFEFLIIDDSSTDRTVEIIKNFKDSRILFYENESRLGIAATLNKGIIASKYELVARMDADDISHPWRFEKQVNYLLENPECALLASHVNIIDKEGRFKRVEGIRSEFIYYSLNFECVIFHPTVIFRKSKIFSIGSYNLPYAEDYDLFWRIAQRFIISTIEEPLLSYREHDQNTSKFSKREEYEEYTLKLISRNIRYFIGDRVVLKKSYVECYRNNFVPLLEEADIDEFINCIKCLQMISNEIMATENPNRNFVTLKYIIEFKRNYLIYEFLKLLPLKKVLQLFAKDESLPIPSRIIFKWVKYTLKQKIYFGKKDS